MREPIPMVKSFFCFLFFVCCFILTGKAQIVYPPDLHCVTLVNNPPGAILLTWSLPSNACGPFVAYNIYRSTDINGPYLLIYTEINQSATTHVDAVGNGNSVTYYYYMVSDYNCPGATFLNSDTIDNLDPVSPVINYVTVFNNNAVINWEPSTSPETYGYIIYKVVGGNQPIDTVYGLNNTTYTDFNSSLNTDTASYTLSSIDSCLNTGPLNVAPQHTIYLEQTIDHCNRTILLKWLPYENWQHPIQQYDVYESVNGGLPTLVTTLSPDSLSYHLKGMNDGDSICVTIVATESTTLFTSASNSVCSKVNIVQAANDLYIRNVTVAGPKEIDVYYSMDSLADLVNIRIERGLDSVYFSPLATFTPPADLSLINMFSDTMALPDELSYYYRIITTDSCNGNDTSTIGKSVLLTGYAFTDLSYLLRWDESFIEHATVTGYTIYRDDGSGFNKVTTLSSSIFEYSESALPTVTPCYYAEALDSLVFPNGVVDTVRSRSNVLCLNQPNQIYMPNAFAPEGKNNIFKPILSFTTYSSYSFTVYNRWGEIIFTSKNPDTGWDGRYNGNIVQQGAYAYEVLIVDDTKKQLASRGTVLVVR